MKRLRVLCMIAMLSFATMHGQEQQKNPLVETFVKDYNTDDYDDFYKYFSASLKEELPINQAKNFFVEMKQKLGNIKHIEFYGLDDNQIPLYKTEFENQEVALINVAFNKEGQIDGFRIMDMPGQKQGQQPYIGKTNEELVFAAASGLPEKGQFAVAIIDKDQVDFLGVENKKGKIVVKDNSESLFSMANFATILTSTLYAEAVISGKIDRTANANDYYDFAFHNGIELPLTKLANHTAFVPMLPPVSRATGDQDAFFSNYNQDQLHDYLKSELVIDSLNTQGKQSFSFLGYAILGDVVTSAMGSDYKSLVEDRIFAPYQMKSSLVEYNKKNKKIVKGIDRLGNQAKEVPANAFKYATSSFSSSKDMSKFIQAQFNKQDKLLAMTRQPTTIVSPEFWLSSGWKIALLKDLDSKLYFLRGIDSGYSNYIGFDPIKHKGVVILSNTSTDTGLKALDELSYLLMMKLFDEK